MDKVSKKNQMIRNKIKTLKEKFKKLKIDGYIVPKNDEYFSEYAKNDRLKKISNFSGSAGIAVILKKKISKNTRLMAILCLKMMSIFLNMQKMID